MKRELGENPKQYPLLWVFYQFFEFLPQKTPLFTKWEGKFSKN